MLGLPEIHTVLIMINNQLAIQLAQNLTANSRTKHIEARYHFIRDAVKNKDVELKWVALKDNIADLFTKALGKLPFQTN